MTPTADDLSKAFCGEACTELQQAAATIEHCLGQLNDAQIWWRPSESMNSIANLMLHLCGNLRQWIISGIGGQDDVRDRPAEFSERGPLPRDALMSRLAATIADAQAALTAASAAALLQPRRIQAFDVTGMQAMFHSVAHFRGHTQEIVHLTRAQLGDDYKFALVPATPEQGVPSQ